MSIVHKIRHYVREGQGDCEEIVYFFLSKTATLMLVNNLPVYSNES